MREIPMLEPLLIGSDDEEKTKFGVPELLLWAINSAPDFNKNGFGIRASVRLEVAVREANGVICVDDDAYKILQSFLDAAGEFPVSPARALGPHLQAIALARSTTKDNE